MAAASAHAALLLPVSGDKLGLGGHLRMHRTIAVDSASPDSSLWVTGSGEVRVKAIRINQQLLTATPIHINRLSSAIAVDPAASGTVVTVGDQGLSFAQDNDGVSFGGGARLWSKAGGGLNIKPGDDLYPIAVRDANDLVDELILRPATISEAVDGTVTNKPVTPVGLKAAIDNAMSSGFILTATKIWDPPPISSYGKSATTITVTGAQVGDVCVAAHTTIRMVIRSKYGDWNWIPRLRVVNRSMRQTRKEMSRQLEGMIISRPSSSQSVHVT